MKTKLIISSVLATGVGLLCYFADQARGERIGEPISSANSMGFSLVWALAAFVVCCAVTFGVPLIWRGLLKCTKDFSKAAQGKD